jgi:hypothetical protein
MITRTKVLVHAGQWAPTTSAAKWFSSPAVGGATPADELFLILNRVSARAAGEPIHAMKSLLATDFLFKPWTLLLRSTGSGRHSWLHSRTCPSSPP